MSQGRERRNGMEFMWLTAGLFERLAEKTVDVAVQQGLTAWQLRRLEHLGSPLLRRAGASGLQWCLP